MLISTAKAHYLQIPSNMLCVFLLVVTIVTAVNSGRKLREHSNDTTLTSHSAPMKQVHIGGQHSVYSYRAMMFNLTMKLRSDIYNKTSNGPSSTHTPAFESPIHLLRIPKASSTSMSVLARRMVGCEPPGPCCLWPGFPPGSCPSKDLGRCLAGKRRVIGCINHNSNLESLKSNTTPTFSMMRHPYSRAFSGFFYPGPHHNKSCTGDIETCFVEYTKSPQWQNVAVKMLTGGYAYSPNITCVRKGHCEHSLDDALVNLSLVSFMGITELWELSLAVLHLSWPRFEPKLEDFHLNERELGHLKEISHLAEMSHFKELRRSLEPTWRRKYLHLLELQNALDLVLYKRVVERLCAEVRRLGLWQHEFVREYWRAKVVKSQDDSLCSSEI